MLAWSTCSRNGPSNNDTLLELLRGVGQGQHDEQHGRDHDVDGRPRDRDQELLDRLLGDALEPRHAADRQQHDVAGADAVPPGSERVPELVQDDAGEQGEDEEDAARRRGDRASFLPVLPADEDQQQEEGRVDLEVDPRDPSQLRKDHFIGRAGCRHATSNRPAAPIPPPMHIVMTTYLAPRRLPSISAWPTMRAPLMP